MFAVRIVKVIVQLINVNILCTAILNLGELIF